VTLSKRTLAFSAGFSIVLAAAWGAGLGYLFGAIAENNARYRVVEQPVYIQQTTPAPVVGAQPQNITIINNYYNTPATPMSAANGLFGRN